MGDESPQSAASGQPGPLGPLALPLSVSWGLFALAWRGFDTAREGSWQWRDYFLYLVPGVLTAAVAGALFWARRRLEDVNALIRKQVDVDAWPSFRKLTVLEFTQMLVLRGTSLLALTSKVFMNRVRGLIYNRVYADPEYHGRRMPNLIHALSENSPALFSAHPWMKPGPHLAQLAQQASRMPTTLWFTSGDQFTTVESAGEATVCFVLLRQIIGHHKGEYEPEGQPLNGLFEQLRKEWAAFNQEPSSSRDRQMAAA